MNGSAMNTFLRTVGELLMMVCLTPVTPNPVLRLSRGDLDYGTIKSNVHGLQKFHGDTFCLDLLIFIDSTQELDLRGPSYLDTYLTMPPTTHAKVGFTYALDFSNTRVEAHIERRTAKYTPLMLRTLVKTALASKRELELEVHEKRYYGEHQWDSDIVSRNKLGSIEQDG